MDINFNGFNGILEHQFEISIQLNPNSITRIQNQIDLQTIKSGYITYGRVFLKRSLPWRSNFSKVSLVPPLLIQKVSLDNGFTISFKMLNVFKETISSLVSKETMTSILT